MIKALGILQEKPRREQREKRLATYFEGSASAAGSHSTRNQKLSNRGTKSKARGRGQNDEFSIVYLTSDWPGSSV